MEKENIINAERANVIAPAGNGGYVAVYEQMTDSFQARYLNTLAEKYERYYTADFDGDYFLSKNHFETFVSDTEYVHFAYHLHNGRAVVTYMPREEGLELPAREAPSFERAGENYPTIFTDIGSEHYHRDEMATCHMIRVADGSFVIIDSAYGEGIENVIYKVLKKQAPDPDHIVISAWIFTHAHWDHVGGFWNLADNYAGDPSITLEQVVCNFPDDSLLAEFDQRLQNRTIESAKKLNPDVKFVKPHTGQTLYYADVKFRILYTQEDELAVNDFFRYYNSASLVFQMETEGGVTYLCGGDHCVFGQVGGTFYGGEGALYRWYDSFLHSDITDVFHHALGGGADNMIYPAIAPKLVIWPASWNRIYNDGRGNPYGTSLDKISYNTYFTDPEKAKANGVEYIVSGDAIHVIHFKDGAFTVTKYETAEDYLNA